MSRKFDILKKKHLPDEARIRGFTFLKEPKKDENGNYKKDKFDFIEQSNENTIGCMLPKRKSWGFTRGYVAVDGKEDTFVEVKSRVLVFILFGLGCIVGLWLLFMLLMSILSPNYKPGDEFKKPIINVIGDIWDGTMPDNGDKNEQPITSSIEIPGYAFLWVSKEDPYITLVNPAGNSVYFQYEITLNGETILTTDHLKPNSQINVNLYEKMNTPGIYDIKMIINTLDTETLAVCNGAVQDVSIKVY